VTDRPAEVTVDRAPPQDFDSEQAVLGSILLEPEAAARAFAIVVPEDFFRTYHRQIASAMKWNWDQGLPVDLVTVSAELRRRGQLEEVGGGEYLTALIGEVPTVAHVARYANIVVECALKRAVILLGSEMMTGAYDNPEDVGEYLRGCQKRLDDLQRSRVRTIGRLESMKERENGIMQVVADAGAGRKPLSSARLGIPELDELLGPLSGHGIILNKGGTGSGKTHISINALMASAEEEKRRGGDGQIVVFSFESRGMYERRMLAWLSGVNNEDIRRGFDGSSTYRDARGMTGEEKWVKLYEAADHLATLPIWLSERKNTQQHIEEQWQEALKRGPIILSIIDYWQAMKKDSGRNLYEEYKAATQTFMHLLDDTHTPGLISSQVTENYAAKGEAAVGHSKDSRDIEDSATIIMRLRKDLLTCEKNRHGPQFSPMKLHIDYPTSRVYTEERWAAMEARRQPPLEQRDEPRTAGGDEPPEDPFGGK
jgi:replicative DNA helicase